MPAFLLRFLKNSMFAPWIILRSVLPNTALLLPGHAAEAAGSRRSRAASLLMPRSRTQFR
jgi:hypothetical protein